MTRRTIPIQHHFERVIWLVPGKITGCASLGSDMSFSSAQLDFHALGNDIESYARFHNNQLALGFERSEDSLSEAEADEVVGMVRWIAYKYNTSLLAPASPADLGTQADEDKLRTLRWHRPDRGLANQAAAHLLAWLLREGRAPMHLVAELFPA